MNRLVDRAALLIFGLGPLFFLEPESGFVAAFLTALVYLSLNEYFDNAILDNILAGLWAIAVIFWPEMALFFPIVAYSMAERKTYILLCISALVAIFRSPLPINQALFFVIAGGLMAVLLHFRTLFVDTLKKKITLLRDTTAERAILLEERNKSLVAKQNAEVYAATLRERNRIAREIHDNVGHLLSRSILMVGALKAVSAANPDAPGADIVKDLDATLNTAMTSIRESVHDLHDEAIDLEDSLRLLLKEYNYCETAFIYDASKDIPREVKYSFIAIVKEALNNVTKHSNATKVSVTVREHPGLYQLRIEDNGATGGGGGRPADDGIPAVDNRGMGIENMTGRVKSLGGNIQITRTNGYRIYITVPRGA
ncbi:MAG: histidine kinase [Lachnospiraceae bacterium]|jgi:signal transduction histidine kinase|nr:histidine kinase [Lachnospiraceae bacterium]